MVTWMTRLVGVQSDVFGSSCNTMLDFLDTARHFLDTFWTGVRNFDISFFYHLSDIFGSSIRGAYVNARVYVSRICVVSALSGAMFSVFGSF